MYIFSLAQRIRTSDILSVASEQMVESVRYKYKRGFRKTTPSKILIFTEASSDSVLTHPR